MRNLVPSELCLSQYWWIKLVSLKSSILGPLRLRCDHILTMCWSVTLRAAEWHHWEAPVGCLPLEPSCLCSSDWWHETTHSGCCIHSFQGNPWDHRGYGRPYSCKSLFCRSMGHFPDVSLVGYVDTQISVWSWLVLNFLHSCCVLLTIWKGSNAFSVCVSDTKWINFCSAEYGCTENWLYALGSQF